MLVRQAVGGLTAGANLDVVCFAHEVVVVDAFGALASANVGKNLGKATHGIRVNERSAGGVVLAATDGDSECGASVVVESARANATGGYFGNVFGHCSSWCGS
ncbi:hypothetical protein AAur_0633 [Paenarthrobacter aurescens TC1]|uniref:Uncharacterized protein n=1 Tax=Paenarthrobacter aurescens (strain TC1) TaxID=290340 RepID=A1R2H7_PAEAT|nr:hypothetical protein AAur_0633 [Paenarthrobacter aurescens TC1]